MTMTSRCVSSHAFTAASPFSSVARFSSSDIAVHARHFGLVLLLVKTAR
jgi:hypothetical protein